LGCNCKGFGDNPDCTGGREERPSESCPGNCAGRWGGKKENVKPASYEKSQISTARRKSLGKIPEKRQWESKKVPIVKKEGEMGGGS